MNIWILNHHARDTGRHPSLAEYLTRLGENVTLFSSSFEHNNFVETKEYDKNFFIEENVKEYKRIYIKTPKYKGNGVKRLLNQLVFSVNTYKAGRRVLKDGNKPDVIMGSSVHLFTGLSAYFLARKTNTKFVFEIRDLWPKTLVDLGALKEKSLLTRLFYLLEKFLYKKADLIISVLPDADKYIENLGIDYQKIVHIPNGIDLEYMDESLENDDIRRKVKDLMKGYSNEFVVSFTGAHGKANGLETIIETARILQDVELEEQIKTRFLLVGEGPEKEKLINKVKRHSLSNVTFINRMPKSYIPHILNQSNVCLFHLVDTPVFNYGISSNKIFDYMYSGKPVIFAVKSSNDFAKLAECGITVQPENPTDFADAIKKMKNLDEVKLLEYGFNGKEYVRVNHSFNELAAKLKFEFKKVINKN